MLQSDDKSLTNEELLLMDEQKKRFLGMESISGKNSVETVEMTANYIDYYINLVYKAVAVFERTDSSFERSSAVEKMLSNSIA